MIRRTAYRLEVLGESRFAHGDLLVSKLAKKATGILWVIWLSDSVQTFSAAQLAGETGLM